jgi:HEAT repeat protein
MREFRIVALTPELLAAFDRFFENPEKIDPQCWAKNAISRTLAAFEHQDADLFLRGMRHIQMEPVWGGRSDTAGTLRATCALALVQCRSLTEADLLTHLIELLADKDKAVRTEVVRAMEQVGSHSASLLLRLRAVLGSDEPEVFGACYGAVLRIEGIRALPWVSRFLVDSPEGFEALKSGSARALDPWFRSALLSATALSRQDAAIEFLLDLVRTESLDVEAAIEALLRSMPTEELVKRLGKIGAGNARLKRAFATCRKSQS